MAGRSPVVASGQSGGIERGPSIAMHFEERRHCPRVKLDKLAYVNLHSGNGGIVLDVSDKGLGLQAAASLEAAGPIRFRLSVASIDQIEAAGEIRWIDETGKRGGLRFTHLPLEVERQMRAWLGESKLSSHVVRDRERAPEAETEFPAASRYDPAPGKANHRVSPPVEVPTANVSRAPDSEPWPFFRESPPIGGYGAGTAGRGDLNDAVRLGSRLAPVMVSVATVFLVVIGLLSYAYKRETGEFLIHLGETVSGEFRPQTAAPATPPAQSSPPESAPPSGAPSTSAAVGGPSEVAGKGSLSDVEHSATQTAEGKAAETAGAPAPEQSDLSQAEDNGQSELALARQYLRESSGPGNSAAAVDLLWSAVQKGSDGAEVDLAELYLHGDGVKKNCEQARVLLMAASKRNNPVAEKKLAELSEYGCK
jgi:hypothetical protein